MSHVIRFENVSKAILENKIFEKVNFEFSNNIYHLIGNNGAGKTTLFKLIMGLELPTDGKIFLDEQRISPKTISSIYYAPDELQIYDFLTGMEFLNWIAKVRLHSDDDLDGLILGFNLQNSVNKSFAEMSLGTKKKFVLISALIGKPKFILFDEPFNGLDPSSQEYLQHNILECSKQSGIIFTHHHIQKLDFKVNVHKIKIAHYNLNFESIEQSIAL